MECEMTFRTIAATVLGSAILTATPSLAQIQFGIDPNGRPNVQVGPSQDDVERQYRRERREQWRARQRVYEDETTGSVRRRGNCRVVTIEEQAPNGDTIVRRRERCDD